MSRQYPSSSAQEMTESGKGGQEDEEEEDEEEYVLLDLNSISAHIHIQPNAPYVLSGLDTLNPILVIDNKIKLIGEYEETIGTCLLFSESGAGSIVQEGPSEANLIDPKPAPTKQVNPLARVDKVLKFRVFLEAKGEDGVRKQANEPS